MKTAVIYKSHYGTTKQYAMWIAEELNAELFEAPSVKPEMLAEYDMVIYGGALYAGRIIGIESVVRNACKSLVVFTVGLVEPTAADYAEKLNTEILSKNLPADLRSRTKVFHLRGGVDYKKLSIVHRGMMAMVKSLASKKPEQERTSEEKTLLETYGAKVDFMNRDTVSPLVEYVKGIYKSR